MTSLTVTPGKPLPTLPPEVPWPVRSLCYAARHMRGYGRILPALARMEPSLQEVKIESAFAGTMWLDLRELICLPVFVHGYCEFQYAQYRLLDQFIHEGMRIFDIGANIGDLTAFFSRRIGPHGLVVAVEPMPRALRLLNKTAQLCGVNVTVVEAAVGAQPGEAQLVEMQQLNVSFVQFGKPAEGRSITAPVTPIDDLTEKFGMPDFLKIDVEGAEIFALQGAGKTLAAPNAPVVMIEYIASNAANFGGYSLADVLAYFPKGRFQAFRIIQSGQIEEVDHVTHEATEDYLLVPLNRLAEMNPLLATPAAIH